MMAWEEGERGEWRGGKRREMRLCAKCATAGFRQVTLPQPGKVPRDEHAGFLPYVSPL